MSQPKDDDYWDESYHQPFMWETNMAAVHDEEVRLANLAVKEALEAHKKQWFITRAAKAVWGAIFWVSYYIRLRFALKFTEVYCKATGKESRLVSPKVWHRLGI